MTTIPKVSVGMPVYNGEPFIGKALGSLLSQTFFDFELIISDNASTDGTQILCEEYAAKDRRIRYIRQSVNRGAIANFNFVLKEARGEYFMWAAADDTWDRQWIEILLNGFREGAVISSGHLCTIDASGNVVRTYKPLTFSKRKITRLLQLYMTDESKGKACLVYGMYRTAFARQYTLIEDEDIWEAWDLFFVYKLACEGEILTNPKVRIYNRLSGRISYAPYVNPVRKLLRRLRYSIEYIKLAPDPLISLIMWLLLPVKITNAVIQYIIRDPLPNLSNT
jgi:glycosyltransferase involved in cell wall biosynthesis